MYISTVLTYVVNNTFSYERAYGTFDDIKKRHELSEESARYIVVFERRAPVGFVHFRFDVEDDREVIYWYACNKHQIIQVMRYSWLKLPEIKDWVTT